MLTVRLRWVRRSLVSISIRLAAFQVSGGAYMKLVLYIKSDTVPRSISPQSSLSTQRLFNFFLGVLCDLRGELLCSFSQIRGQILGFRETGLGAR
jgi:hypothetical protein